MSPFHYSVEYRSVRRVDDSNTATGDTVAALDVISLVDEGLGNWAYLVDLGDGRALAVDASRDLRALRAAAARRGLRVAYAADTHLHADFLSGARPARGRGRRDRPCLGRREPGVPAPRAGGRRRGRPGRADAAGAGDPGAHG